VDAQHPTSVLEEPLDLIQRGICHADLH
jgi:hypothetical protein